MYEIVGKSLLFGSLFGVTASETHIQGSTITTVNQLYCTRECSIQSQFFLIEQPLVNCLPDPVTHKHCPDGKNSRASTKAIFRN